MVADTSAVSKPNRNEIPNGDTNFSGFDEPNFTGIPNKFFDEIMQQLSEPELRAMLYIFRHTYGWNKHADAISYNQFLQGIKARDGRQIDKGAGVCNSSLAKGLESLVKRGYIFRHRRFAPNGSKLATVYELNVKGVPRYNPTTDPDVQPILPTPLHGVAPYSATRSSPTPLHGDTPTPLHGDTKDMKNQKKDQQHTQQPMADKEDTGANALCVTDTGDTYPISDEANISEEKTQPKRRIRRPQDNTTGRRGGDSTSDRTNAFKPIQMPVHGLQGQIAQRLRQVRIAATQAGKLSAQIVAAGRDLDYVERWIAFVERENKTNPAGFLVRVLSDLAEPPQSAQAHTKLDAEKYVTGKYASVFNRQPLDDTTPPEVMS